MRMSDVFEWTIDCKRNWTDRKNEWDTNDVGTASWRRYNVHRSRLFIPRDLARSLDKRRKRTQRL
jgi:hypothetical protein